MTRPDQPAPNPREEPEGAETPLPEISVVVPVLNEAETIAGLAAEIAAALDGRFDYEIVFIDDGSTDATPACLREAAAHNPNLHSLRHRERSGQSAAVASGVRAARGRFIATLDGDGQNDPADIPKLLEAAHAAPDPGRILIAGHRTMRKDTASKRLSSRIANGVRARLLGDGTPDTGCGLKVFARTAFLELPRFDHMHRFLPALFRRAGGSVLSVPVNHRPRAGGVTKYGMFDRLWVGLADLAGVMWLQRRPLNPEIATDDDQAD